MKQQTSKITRVCQFCNEKFSAHRSDTRFCSVNHRVAYSRWRTRLMALELRITRDIGHVDDYRRFPDAEPTATDILKGVISTIKFHLK